jgi:transcription antitermination protein NusB
MSTDQSAPKLTSTGAKKASAKSNRTRAREFALQALYQYKVGKNDPTDVDLFTRDLSGFHKADSAHYDALLHGCIAEAQALDALILPLLDRKIDEISPIEHAVMWLGAYEFKHCLDVPWRVVLNEYIELAKEFGGTDGHKYVNAVLNGIAPKLRADEVTHDRSHGRAAPRPAKATAPDETPTAKPTVTVRPPSESPNERPYNDRPRNDRPNNDRPPNNRYPTR